MAIVDRLKHWTGLGTVLLIMLLFIPVAIVLEFTHAEPLYILIISSIAIVPLAALIGKGTEALAEKVGERAGGLLNATLGNAAELIISIVALRQGLITLVLASITGSILGNLLLIMGLSLLLGGLKFGTQRFNREVAGMDATLLVLSVFALAIPSIFNAHLEPDFIKVETLSVASAILIILMYALTIVYAFTAKRSETEPITREAHAPEGWSTTHAMILLVAAVAFVALLSEFLVGAIEPVTAQFGLSEFFIGIILVPLVGNVAEHLVAVQVAVKNKMDLSLGIAIGSSLQIALLVAPLLVFISLAIGNPMPLEFNIYELLAMAAASLIAAFIALDGRSNWLEGAMLLVVYALLAVAFFFL